MALISCPECTQQISDQAVTCPHCGYDIAKVVRSQKTVRNARGLIIIGFVAFMLYAMSNAYTDWSDKRAAKKAAIAEMERRNAMTPEQRIAEDQVRARKKIEAQNKAERAFMASKREAEEKPYRGACLIYMKSALHDPSSFEYGDSWISTIDSTQADVWIEGRAKNAFGALVKGTWKCRIEKSGDNFIARSIEQVK